MTRFTVPSLTGSPLQHIQRVPESALPSLADAAGEAGLLALELDFSDCHSKDAILDRFADSLAFPEWFGHNWDALADALMDLATWQPAAGHALLLHGTAHLEADPGSGFAVALEILDETLRTQSAGDPPLWIFIADANPAPDNANTPEHSA